MCSSVRVVGAALGVSLLVVAGWGCAVNPATGKRQLSLVSESQEIEMGREADGMVQAQMGVYGGTGLQDYVQRVGRDLAAVSERPNLEWSFRVVDDPTVNAFALPGGYIYITRGIMAHLNSEAELATVVGHEIGHVTARHSVNQMSKAQLAQIGLGLGAAVSPEVAQYGQFAEMGVGLMFLKFSRDDERQADDLGLRYMVTAGYDPRPAPQVFDMLGNVSAASGGDRVPGWLSTHPAPENREAHLQQKIAELDQTGFKGSKIGQQEYYANIEGMVYGNDPREGYFSDNRFFHPQSEFRFDFPAGWPGTNGRESVVGRSPGEDAVIRIMFASAASPDQALERFLGQDGVNAGSSWIHEINGYPVASRRFSAATSGGGIQGLVAYLQHGGVVFELIGFALDSSWETRRGAIESSLGSFKRLTDPAALAVEPARIRVVQPDSDMALREFARRYDATVSVETLALINHIDPSATLQAGQPYKSVSGGVGP